MYTSHGLTRADDHTLQCRTGGITYVPIPPGSDLTHVGLFSVELPASLPRGRRYDIVVRQVTNAYSKGLPPRQLESGVKGREGVGSAQGRPTLAWRRVLGAFQVSIPVKPKDAVLRQEERDLSVLRWIGGAIPPLSRWHLVFGRYLEIIAGRVKEFGGNRWPCCLRRPEKGSTAIPIRVRPGIPIRAPRRATAPAR